MSKHPKRKRLFAKLAMLAVEILALIITINLRMIFFNREVPFFLFLIFLISSFFIFKVRFLQEKKLKKTTRPTTKKILIFTVIKNDLLSAKRFVENYVKFPENFHILIFDDSSTDGTYEYLLNTSKKFRNVEVRKLVRSQRVLHPKGEGLEKALKEEKYDFVFLCDGDSVIPLQDLNFLVYVAEKKNLDYVSAQRRNVEKHSISYISADTNEIFMSIMDIILKIIGGTVFPGSGQLFRRKSFKELKFDELCLSDDTYVGNWILKHKKRGEKFYSISVRELAPERFSSRLSQVLKWTKNGMLERTKKPSVSILFQDFLMLAAVFSIAAQGYILWLTSITIAILFGVTLGATLSFNRNPFRALIGFSTLSFELLLSLIYMVYLYNLAIFGSSSTIFTGNFRKTE